MLDRLPKIDERVILTSKVFGSVTGNPLWGSNIGCPGTVYGVDGETITAVIRVEWDNGAVNSYRCEHLDFHSILSEDNPNTAFLRSKNKITRRKK